MTYLQCVRDSVHIYCPLITCHGHAASAPSGVASGLQAINQADTEVLSSQSHPRAVCGEDITASFLRVKSVQSQGKTLTALSPRRHSALTLPVFKLRCDIDSCTLLNQSSLSGTIFYSGRPFRVRKLGFLCLNSADESFLIRSAHSPRHLPGL